MNLLSFYLKCLLIFHSWRIVCQIRILGWPIVFLFFFLFQTLNTLFSVPADLHVFSHATSIVNLIEGSFVCVKLLLSRCFQIFFNFLFLGFDTLNIMCRSVDLFEFILGVCWDSWMYMFMFVIRLGNFRSLFLHFFFLTLFSFSSLLWLVLWLCLRMFCRSLRLYSFLFFIFSFCSSD